MSTTTPPVIGFIGLGFMGHGMAKNIVTKGYQLHVMGHRNRTPVESLKSLGATEVANQADLAATCDIIFICVTGSPQVEALMRGPAGVFANGRPGLIVIDCSTSNPVSTQALAAEGASKGITFLDAPLGGTPVEAEAGQLLAMVGADGSTFAKVEPVIACWAGRIMHLGQVSVGHTTKLINNFVAMGYGALYAEALAIGRKAGLTPEKLHQVIGSGRMRCGFYDTFMGWTIDGNENSHKFTITNAHKDMRYLASLANEIGALSPLQSLVKNSYAAMDAAGQGERFVPMLADFVAHQNGLKGAHEQ